MTPPPLTRAITTALLLATASLAQGCAALGEPYDKKLALKAPWASLDSAYYIVPGTHFPVAFTDACVPGNAVRDPVFDEPLDGLGWGDYCTTDVAVQRVVSASVDDPSIFSIEQTNDTGLFALQARAPGTTVFRATVIDTLGQEQSSILYLSASYGDEVIFGHQCERSASFRPLFVDTEFTVSFAVHEVQDQRRLPIVGARHLPLDVGPLTLVRSTLSNAGVAKGSLTYRTPSAPGKFTITSPLDPNLKPTLEFYDLSSITALSMRLPPDKRLLDNQITYAKMIFDVTVYGQQPCRDEHSRRLTIETPESCRLTIMGGPTELVVQGPEFAVQGTRGTTCRIRVQLEGTDVVTVSEIAL
jgi:hypothetical protein